MGRLVRWIVGVLSALAVWRLWSRRRREAPPVETEPTEPDPADELRRKLADARTDEPEPAEPAPAPEPAETLEERRARVHAKAQEAMDAMREDDA